ncbi:MAG: aminotransferase class I/II-fold pyridoxal phosphate-dependent enzyme [Candidatus Parabeggiatoa sp.]|nr:aminotransferase class I/II-fold pyridoxal phosphate-dependent enzyme [Candidatus Parabeggiatoa sp.]
MMLDLINELYIHFNATGRKFLSTKEYIDSSSKYSESVRERHSSYGRFENLTWRRVEEELSHLSEAEDSILFPSGMNAIFSIIMVFLKANDVLIINKPIYAETPSLFAKLSDKIGFKIITISCIDQDALIEKIEKNANNLKMVFLEIPTNPYLFFIDIERVRKVLHEDTLLVADSSLASPVDFSPIKYGADLVAISCSKYLSGHDDFILGHVAGRTELILKLKVFRDFTGNIPGVMESYLLSRSLKTLVLRMKYINSLGLKIAQFLTTQPKIEQVYYTGVEDHPHYEIAKKYVKGYGGLIFFVLDADNKQTQQFIYNLKIPKITSNFGTPYSIVEQVAYSMSDPKIFENTEPFPDNLVRLSVGFLDNADEIINDLEQALLKM